MARLTVLEKRYGRKQSVQNFVLDNMAIKNRLDRMRIGSRKSVHGCHVHRLEKYQFEVEGKRLGLQATANYIQDKHR